MTNEQLAAADALADAVERARAALDGPSVEFGRALYAMFASLDAYHQVGVEATPKRRRRKG